LDFEGENLTQSEPPAVSHAWLQEHSKFPERRVHRLNLFLGFFGSLRSAYQELQMGP